MKRLQRLAILGGKPQTSYRFDPEEAVRQLLLFDWRELFPLRRTHGELIRHIIAQCPWVEVAARAAFGLGQDTPGAINWLYRDFYIHKEPQTPSLDRALGRLRRGDASELLETLADPDLTSEDFYDIWYEVSTLAGRSVGTLQWQCFDEPDEPRVGANAAVPGMSMSAISWDEDNVTAPIGALVALPNGLSAGSRIRNMAALIPAIRRVLTGPVGVEPHRQNLLQSVRILHNRQGSPADIGDAMTLLLLHTDLPLRRMLPVAQLRPEHIIGLRRALTALEDKLLHPLRFCQHLYDGLRSPSRQRRFLSYRLLLLEGHLDNCDHPDDRAAKL